MPIIWCHRQDCFLAKELDSMYRLVEFGLETCIDKKLVDKPIKLNVSR